MKSSTIYLERNINPEEFNAEEIVKAMNNAGIELAYILYPDYSDEQVTVHYRDINKNKECITFKQA